MDWLAQLSWERGALIQLLWFVLLLVVGLFWLERRAQGDLGQFISSIMQKRLAIRTGLKRKLFRLALIAGMLIAGVLALRGPVTSGSLESVTTKRPTANIIVALDVSKSMLAQDTAPNRLARARAAILEMIANLTGHRIGLVAFAGGAQILTPLTTDYESFRVELREAGPKSVSRGGTQIGDAIRKSLVAFGSSQDSKILLLITDGEDHDSYPLDAAKAALEQGVRIVTIGFGSEQGSEIIIVDAKTGARTTLSDRNGQVVRSRLDGETLRKIADATKGVYIPATPDLNSILSRSMEPMMRDATRLHQQRIPTQHYHWFVLASLICFIGAIWLKSTGVRL